VLDTEFLHIHENPELSAQISTGKVARSIGADACQTYLSSAAAHTAAHSNPFVPEETT
jgi:hypothetical protein